MFMFIAFRRSFSTTESTPLSFGIGRLASSHSVELGKASNQIYTAVFIVFYLGDLGQKTNHLRCKSSVEQALVSASFHEISNDFTMHFTSFHIISIHFTIKAYQHWITPCLVPRHSSKALAALALPFWRLS